MARLKNIFNWELKSELYYKGCFDSLYDECQKAESVG